MGDSSGQYTKLPPGWDCKYDQATGNCYYINYFTKAMQLEDPRMRYKPLQNDRCSTESIVMAPLHGSPYHVYPSNSYPAVRAFQCPTNSPGCQNLSASPLLSSRSNLEMSPVPVVKSTAPPHTPRLASASRRSTIQETSFSNQIDSDAVVTKIQNMFPTAEENHIRLLLKRYMKNIFPKADETLLLDILANADNNVQTASEKLISMGYVKRDFAVPKVNKSSSADEKLIPLRPKNYTAEEKEAMKLRLTQKYHKIAERIILMALESVSYAEDRATQILQIVQDEDETRERKTGELPQEDRHNSRGPAEATTTTDGVQVPHEEKHRNASVKIGQQRLLPSINVTTPSTVTTKHILMHESNNETFSNSNNEKSQKSIKQKGASNSLEPTSSTSSSSSSTLKSLSHTLSPSSPSSPSPSSQSFQTITTKSILERLNSNESGSSKYLRKSSGCTHPPSDTVILDNLKLSRSRDKINSLKYSSRGSTEDGVNSQQRPEFKSILGRLATVGHNEDLAKGSDDSLLLADYVTWNGANPNISVGQKQMVAGTDAALLSERSCTALGRNPDLCKGPKPGLAKGSIYAQLAAAVENIKCN